MFALIGFLCLLAVEEKNIFSHSKQMKDTFIPDTETPSPSPPPVAETVLSPSPEILPEGKYNINIF